MAVILTVNSGLLNKCLDAHTKLYINDTLAVIGSVFNTGDTIKIVADSGYTFYKIGKYDSSVSYRSPMGGHTSFTLSEDFKTVTSSLSSYGGGLTVLTDQLTPDTKGINDVYLLKENQVRAITQSSFTAGAGTSYTDYGDYIIGLIDLPFKVDPSLIVKKQAIQLGNYNTNIEADLLSSDVIKLDMGVIEVIGNNNNLLDYKNTVALLHLPYCETITLEIDYVVNKQISIEYVINLYDGMVTVNVSSSKINGVISTRSVDMGVKIPFANLKSYPSKNNPKNVELGADNGVKTPYIELMRNDAILADGFFTIPIIDEALLNTQTGYVEVENINLATHATSSEKDMINNFLRGGVIIN